MLTDCIIFRGELFRYGLQNSRLNNGSFDGQLHAMQSALKFIENDCRHWNYKVGIDTIIHENRQEDFNKLMQLISFNYIRIKRVPRFNQLSTFFDTLTWSSNKCSRTIFIRCDLLFLRPINMCSNRLDNSLIGYLWKVSTNRINDVLLRVNDPKKLISNYPLQLNTSKKQTLHYLCVYIQNCSFLYTKYMDSDPFKQKNGHYEFIGRSVV